MSILLPSTVWMKHDTVFTFKLQQRFLISLAKYCKLRIRYLKIMGIINATYYSIFYHCLAQPHVTTSYTTNLALF